LSVRRHCNETDKQDSSFLSHSVSANVKSKLKLTARSSSSLWELHSDWLWPKQN